MKLLYIYANVRFINYKVDYFKGSPRRVALPIEDIVVESPVKMEVNDGFMNEGGSRTDMADTRNQTNDAHNSSLTPIVSLYLYLSYCLLVTLYVVTYN